MKLYRLFEDFFDDLEDNNEEMTGEFKPDSEKKPAGSFCLYAEIHDFSMWSEYDSDGNFDRTTGVRKGYSDDERKYDLYNIFRVFKSVMNNCQFIENPVYSVEMEVEDWDDRKYFTGDVTDNISSNKRYGIDLYDIEYEFFKKHQEPPKSMHMSAEYKFTVAFEAVPMNMKKLSDQVKNMVFALRNFKYKDGGSFSTDKRYIDKVILKDINGVKTQSDGSHGIYIDTDNDRYFSNFNDLNELYTYLYDKPADISMNDLMLTMLKKTHMNDTIKKIVDSFQYEVKQYGAALKDFKYQTKREKVNNKCNH